jgi:hypothetical protein
MIFSRSPFPKSRMAYILRLTISCNGRRKDPRKIQVQVMKLFSGSLKLSVAGLGRR